MRGLKDIPNAQTARGYLETFTFENSEELLRANREMLSKVQKYSGAQEVTLLSGTQITTVYGHQENAEVGYNPKKHGRPGFQPFFEQTLSFLPEGCWLSKVRLDRGFFCEDTCLYFEAKEVIVYSLRVVVNPKMQAPPLIWPTLPIVLSHGKRNEGSW